MSSLAGCVVYLSQSARESCYVVQPKYYEILKDKLDNGETGWYELDHVHGDGTIFIRLENITELFLATPAYVEAVDTWKIENGG